MPFQEKIWRLLGEIQSTAEQTRFEVHDLRSDVSTIQQRQAVIGEKVARVERMERDALGRMTTQQTSWSRPFMAVLALVSVMTANLKAETIADVIKALVHQK